MWLFCDALLCPPPLPEECREECKFNAVCLVERLGPRCSCEPIQCDGTYRPLCGKDGRTYVNECERQRAECLAKAHIPIKQQGPCGKPLPPDLLRATSSSCLSLHFLSVF